MPRAHDAKRYTEMGARGGIIINSGGAAGATFPTATLLTRVDADTLTLTTNLFDDGTGPSAAKKPSGEGAP